MLLAGTVSSAPVSAQRDAAGAAPGLSLERISPALNARLIGLERAQGVLFGSLAGSDKVDEAAVWQRLSRRLADTAPGDRPDPEADKGWAALGADNAAVVRGAHAFYREVVAVFAGLPPPERKAALAAAVQRYRSRPSLAVADAPKDMTILYDHPYTSFVPPGAGESEPHRELIYPRLTGFMWSAHWYQLAVIGPLETFNDPAERDRGLATVAERFNRKLSFGAPPDAFPTELPLAPAIAPGLVAVHDGAAAIVDNLNMMLDVIADVLVHRTVADRRSAVTAAMKQFTDRQYRCVQADEWILVALRHSIFAQGGPALGTMARDERNAFSGNHGQHYGRRRLPPACAPE
jgi:hypothetical protein